MDTATFFDLLRDTLQREDPVAPATRLADMPEWDSMSAMAIIALADRTFGRKITLADLKPLTTIGDLYALLTR